MITNETTLSPTSAWFEGRDFLSLAPIAGTFQNARAFMMEYGRLLVGSTKSEDMAEENMLLDDEAQRDLWAIVKSFPYASRERQALPRTHAQAVLAVHRSIQTVEKEGTFRTLDFLAEHGKCLDK